MSMLGIQVNWIRVRFKILSQQLEKKKLTEKMDFKKLLYVSTQACMNAK
jgi:hypothetical protein